MHVFRFRHAVLISLCLLAILLPALVQAQEPPPGVSVTCDNGATFENGVEVIIVQMRSGFTYTATAIGIDDFDPVLAVLNEDGDGLCSDDFADAADYEVDLPTTGRVAGGSRSSQVTFDQNSSEAFANISIIVGGYNSMVGEFVLVLEGMAVTSGDGQGDPFNVRLTPGMVASGVPFTTYMIAREAGLDPLFYRIDENLDVVEDSRGNVIACDDGGDPDRCWGESASLESSGVSNGSRTVGGGPYDAMMSFDLEGLELNEDPDFNFYNFIFTSYNQDTLGQYILAFHMGTAEVEGGSPGK